MHPAPSVGVTTPHCIGMKLIEDFSALGATITEPKNKYFWIKNSIKPWVGVMSQHNHTTAQGFVYLWVDHVHHMFYLGSHKGMPTDNYAHSSRRMPKFSMHSVPQGYHRIILAQGNHLDMMLLENRLIKARYRNPLYHNVCANFPAVMHWDEHSRQKMKLISSNPIKKQKHSKIMKLYYADPANRQKQSDHMKRYYLNPNNKQEKIEILKRQWNNPKRKQKHNESMKRYYADPSYRQKMSETSKRQWSDPALRQKQSKTVKRYYSNPANRIKLSENKKRYYADPANRQKMSETQKQIWKDPVLKQKQSERLKKAWKDPVLKQKQSEMMKKYHQQKKLARKALSTEGVVL